MNDIGNITISPRVAIRQHLEATHQDFHALVASLEPPDWDLPSATPGLSVNPPHVE